MREIAVATDLTSRGACAVARAIALANERSSPVTVVHVVDGDLPARLITMLTKEAKEVIEQQISSAIEELKSPNAAPVRIVVEAGRLHQKIAEHITATEVDLLVIGAHGPIPVRDIFVPTTAERILRLTETPVLIARSAAFERRFKRILAAVDFSLPSRRAIRVAAALFAEARFELVHAFDIPYSAWVTSDEARSRYENQLRALVRTEIESFAEQLRLRDRIADIVLVSGDPGHSVLIESERRQSDLIVIGTHGRSGVGRALLGSVAQEVIAGAQCDVLAVRGW